MSIKIETKNKKKKWRDKKVYETYPVEHNL